MNIEDLKIKEIENTFIELPDGVKLAARIFLPQDAESNPVPAILEYIPYRKRDLMRSRDEPIHRYFAMNGYVSIRVDVRGSGDSEGFLVDEYSEQELNDGVHVIKWISEQKWCTGEVGMMGISWGGFNSLQVAARRPPALKAVITLCASDDRYADDAHYMGGCLLNENMQWGSILTIYGAYPPDPEIVGESWKSMWKERIEKLEPFPVRWMQHPWRDSFWKHGSVCENYSAIKAPVYAIGGWADGYSNAVFRLLNGLECPRKGLVGPWAHNFPHDGVPGPSIGFLQEAIRWWDHWLKNKDTGIMDEPMLRVWMQQPVVPQPQYVEWPGRWVAEEVWPSKSLKKTEWKLGVGYMGESVSKQVELSFSSPETTGMRGGEWCGFGADGEMPRDQRPDDGGSLTFDSDPLDTDTEILGSPVVKLHLKCSEPVGLVAIRLCDVASDGSSLRVSYGLLNLSHHRSHDNPEPLERGKVYQIRVKLNDIAHCFPSGHRIRLSLSTNYWPIAWPAPTPTTLTVATQVSSLSLPIREPKPPDDSLKAFEKPEAAPGTKARKLIHLPMKRTIEVDLTTNEMVYTLKSDGGEFDGAALARIEEIGLDVGHYMLKKYRIIENDPTSAKTELSLRTEFKRKDWVVRVVLKTSLSGTSKHFQFSGHLETFENGIPFMERSWSESIPRRLL